MIIATSHNGLPVAWLCEVANRRFFVYRRQNRRRWCFQASIFALIAFTLPVASGQAGDSPQQLKRVEINVIATDHAGHPVTDLEAGDLRVSDDGAKQQITSLKLISSQSVPPVVLLFDLLDLSFQQSGYEAEQLRKSLAGVTTFSPLYLYVLAGNGSVYAIHGLPASGTLPRATADDAAWRENAGTLLNQALEKVSQARAADFVGHPEERFKVTYSALGSLDETMSRFPGRKQLLWITDGIPSSIRFSGEGLVDLSPTLRQLGAAFDRGNIAIYTLDPSLSLGTLNRDGLEVLSAATAGRTLGSSDLRMALKQAEMDASASYLLEYGPPLPHKSEAKYHKVRVTCNRKGVQLRSQEVYAADADK